MYIKAFYTSLLLLFIISIQTIKCLPYPSLKSGSGNWMENLNITSDLGSYASTGSQAAAEGLGSTVGVSGTVTGNIASTSGAVAAPSPSNSVTSEISSQGNCSEYSVSSAQGSIGADASASGDCQLQLENAGIHHIGRESGKITIGMEGQANSGGNGNGPAQSSTQEAMLNQSSAQYSAHGTAEAYQVVQGPLAASSFSGLMAAPGHPTDHVVSGTSETIMSHAIGQTSVETYLNSNPKN